MTSFARVIALGAAALAFTIGAVIGLAFAGAGAAR